MKSPHDAGGAYVRSGYSATSPSIASACAMRLIQKPHVAAELRRRRENIEEKTNVTVEMVVAKLWENVNRAMKAAPVLDQDGNPIGVYEYKGQVANTALKILGDYLGMFTTKVDVKNHTVVEHKNPALESIPKEILQEFLNNLRQRKQVKVEVLEHKPLENGDAKQA